MVHLDNLAVQAHQAHQAQQVPLEKQALVVVKAPLVKGARLDQQEKLEKLDQLDQEDREVNVDSRESVDQEALQVLYYYTY